jgi:hypothetical protein
MNHVSTLEFYILAPAVVVVIVTGVLLTLA